jgi:predicted alpha/beta-fold hydrolase
MPLLASTYHAPSWLPGGHAQTIYAALAGRRPGVALRRERWETPDGDFVDVDWLAAPAPGPRPLLVTFHGLEGGSASHYAAGLAAQAARRGWDWVMPHFRGCGGEPNRRPRLYHSGDSAEADWMLARCAELRPGATLLACGVSLGGNVLLRWLGERGSAAAGRLAAAAAVSTPMDLTAAGLRLERGLSRLYASRFLVTMKQKGTDKLRAHPQLFDRERMRAARTLREFDDVVTAPLHGYRDVADYWTRASARPVLGDIAVPTLVLNARNDPFLPARALAAPAEVSPAVHLEYPREGGHVGFVTGRFPGSVEWMPRRVCEFLASRLP